METSPKLDFGLVPFPSKLEVQPEKNPLILTQSEPIFFRFSDGWSLKPSVFERIQSFLQSFKFKVEVLEGDQFPKGEESRNHFYFCRLPHYDANLGSEGYELVLESNTLFISSNTDQGFFYAIETIKQILFTQIKNSASFEKEGKISICSLKILDSPSYSWRGLHLDVARHFFPKEFIFKFIDLLASHKMNTFHWHLTDDQGWRIEIKKYPKLTQIGSRRDQTLIGSMKTQNNFTYDGTPYGGFYTQDEIREVVAYAADRFVTVNLFSFIFFFFF